LVFSTFLPLEAVGSCSVVTKTEMVLQEKNDIRQGEKDYKKYMGQLKMIKSKGGKEVI